MARKAGLRAQRRKGRWHFSDTDPHTVNDRVVSPTTGLTDNDAILWLEK